MTLAGGGSPMLLRVVHQPASPSIWSAVQSLRRGLSTNPWKEWSDSYFHIFSQNCQFHHRRLESLEHFNAFHIYIYMKHIIYIILSATDSFLEDVIYFLQGHLFHLYVHFLFFCKYTLHVCYVFNVIDRIF